MGVVPWSPLAGGWLSGRYRRGETPAVTSSRLQRQPARHDPASPDNRVKLEAVHKLQELADEAGLTMVHLALGFVLAHPAVSSAIIGPRVIEHLEGLLPAGEITLSDEILDRIDALVPPGTLLNPLNDMPSGALRSEMRRLPRGAA